MSYVFSGDNIPDYPGYEGYPLEWLLEVGTKCEDCGGYGQVQYAVYTWGGVDPEVKDCESCYGYGFIIPGNIVYTEETLPQKPQEGV